VRALIAAGDSAAAARIRAMLAKENLISDATDLGRDSFVLSKFYDYDIILLNLTVRDIVGYELLQQLRAEGVRTVPATARCRAAERRTDGGSDGTGTGRRQAPIVASFCWECATVGRGDAGQGGRTGAAGDHA